jgi:hypothetical protein
LANGKSVYRIVVKLSDDMTAPSATRAPPPWGYKKDGTRRAIFTKNNPYGSDDGDEFKSMKIYYELKTIMVR